MVFYPGDSVSETIAHFIGAFHMHVEGMRAHHTYHEFYHARPHQQGAPDIEALNSQFQPHLQLRGFVPEIGYHGNQHTYHVHAQASQLHLPAHAIPLGRIPWTPDDVGHVKPYSGHVAHTTVHGLDYQPGSSILVVNQMTVAFDNDIVILSDVYVGTPQTYDDADALTALVAEAEAISAPFHAVEMPSAVADIPTWFNLAETAIHQVEAGQDSDGSTLTTTSTLVVSEASITEVTTVTGPTIEGLYINGELADEAPTLEASLPAQLQEPVEAPAEPVVSHQELTINPDAMTPSIAVESGANMQHNDALVVNAGVVSTFLAVAGDYHSINAIIQTNVHSDIDRVDTHITPTGIASTLAFNIADFQAETRDGASHAAETHPNLYPQDWHLSVIQGDMVFLDWIAQYHFLSDGDTHVLSATGTTTTITSGENLGLNNVAFQDLGHYFDLVIVGGSLYDGNFISQTNVLYDNDTLSLLNGMDNANVNGSSSGNLLWNQASILNIGPSEYESGLSGAYTDAISSIQGGNYHMPQSFHGDSTFEGYGGLKVLYISGNLYDLHSIQQVNVMGDADLVALHESAVLGGSSDWNISTGSNALINTASIIDYDSLGTTVQVGGQVYSDALLIQADIVSTDHLPQMGNAALASEVIAFLDIDLDVHMPIIADDHSYVPPSMGDAAPADIMQSVLA